MKYVSLIFAFLLLLPCLSYSQTDEEIFEEFQFNFATPGARADAMGRAFVGLADDATAAQSNPAGLVILTKPEVSFEYKNTSFTVERAAGPNSLVDGTTTDFGQSVSSPAFVSLVYPKGRVRLAFYRQEYLNYKEEFALGTRTIPGTGSSFVKSTGAADFSGVNFGVAFAYQFSPKFYAGFSGKFSQLDVSSVSRKFLTETQLEKTTTIDESQSGFSLTGGILLNPNRKFSIGAIFERNAEFEYTMNDQGLEFNEPYSRSFPVKFKIPDRFAAGVAVRPTDSFTLLADVAVIQYSQMIDSLTIVLHRGTGIDAGDFEIKDATEFHAGAEYIFFAGSNVIAIRGGVFSNPAHGLEYVSEKASVFGKTMDALYNFGPDETEIGYTVGGGLVLAERFQIDAAYLISDPFDEFSTSFVIRF